MNRLNKKLSKFFIGISVLIILAYFHKAELKSANLQCSPEIQSAKVNEKVTIKALGGSGKYEWTAKEGNPSVGSGVEFTTSFSSIGKKKVFLKSGGKIISCLVNVFDVNYTHSCGNNGTCSIKIIQPFKLMGESSPIRPIDLDITATIKNSINLWQDGKILTDGHLVSAVKPIYADARTTEPGGPSGSPGEAGPEGETEPGGPIGVTEPAGPSGEWNETGGVYDTPPIDFSDKCGAKDFTPTLFASKKEKGFILKMGVCAKPGNLSIQGVSCQNNTCYLPKNLLSTNIKIEKTYYLQVKLFAEKSGGAQKGSEVLNFQTPLIPVKISTQKKVVINRPPEPEVSLADSSSIKVNQNIKLSSLSKDPDLRPNKSLEQKWLILKKPQGSQAQISKQDSSSAYFIPDKPGKYEVALLVNDGLDVAKKVITLDVASSQNTFGSAPIKQQLSLKCNGSSDSCYVKMSANAQKTISITPESQDNTNIVNFKLFNIPKGINASLSSNSTNINQPVTLTIKTSYLPSGTYSFVIQASQGAKVKEQFIYVNIVEPSYKIPPEVEILPPLPPGF